MLALAGNRRPTPTHVSKREKNRFGVEITAKTPGVIGCGNIGRIVADRALGLRMKVTHRSVPVAGALGTSSRKSNSTICPRADFITPHTPTRRPKHHDASRWQR
jgi:D-3-phosphoglycerate dehydrogenase